MQGMIQWIGVTADLTRFGLRTTQDCVRVRSQMMRSSNKSLRVPYRSSPLTMLLRDSFETEASNTRCAMCPQRRCLPGLAQATLWCPAAVPEQQLNRQASCVHGQTLCLCSSRLMHESWSFRPCVFILQQHSLRQSAETRRPIQPQRWCRQQGAHGGGGHRRARRL